MNLKKRCKYQEKIINKQTAEIENLKNKINKLQIAEKNKSDLFNCIDNIQNEMNITIDDMKKRKEEYENVILEIEDMKTVINKIIFKGKWWIVKLLIK